MPTEVSCPKCQSKYRLSEAMLGKTLKCKKCETVFRTKPPVQPATATARATSANAGGQASAAELAQLADYGLDGPLRRSADEWADAAPVQHGGLNNFAQDPGFGGRMPAVEESEVAPNTERHELADVISNPFASPAAAQSRAGKKVGAGGKAAVATGQYRLAKTGMWVIYTAIQTVIALCALMVIISIVGAVFPMEPDSSILLALKWIVALVGLVGLLAVLATLVGQVLCIFAPESNEKLNASLVIVCGVGAFLAPLIGGLFIGFSSQLVSSSGAAQAALGLFGLLTIGSAYAMVLAAQFFFINYYQKIGQNLRSKKVKMASKTALLTWLGAIGFAVVGIILLVVASFMSAEDGEPSPLGAMIALGVALGNLGMGIGVLVTQLNMIKTTMARVASV